LKLIALLVSIQVLTSCSKQHLMCYHFIWILIIYTIFYMYWIKWYC